MLALVLAGPFVLAFFSGGYFDAPRLTAAIVAWAAVGVVAVAGRQPLPATAPGRVAVAALAGLAAWTIAAGAWAPVAETAGDDAGRLLLYFAAFLAAAAVAHDRWARDALTPALAGGCLAVVGYGLAGRLLPWLGAQDASVSAVGRLEQPLTYWNAVGLLAAIGVVACVALAGEPERPRRVRTAALPAAAALGVGVHLSFSRGALAALAVGLVAAALLARGRATARAVAVVVPAGVAVSVAASLLDGVRTGNGTLADRSLQGAVVLAVLAAAGALAARCGRWVVAGEDRDAPRLLGARPRWAAVPLAVLAAAAIVLVVAGDRGPAAGSPETGATSRRLGSADSNRYAYWRVAAGAFADAPLRSGGAGSFEVAWYRERPIDEPARDAHSLPLETAAELGLVGLALLGILAAAVAMAAVRARRLRPGRAAAPAAIVLTWAVHAAIDWDWEMPAVTLPALTAAAALVAWGGPRRVTRGARRGWSGHTPAVSWHSRS